MSSGMFRGKESSSRIKLSQLVQELFNFDVLGSLGLWGWGDGWMWVGGSWGLGDGWMWVGGGWGCPPHTCTHMHTHTHTHACVVNMIISCKWLPPLGESMGIPYDVICTCMCMHVHVCACACVWRAPFYHPHFHPITPHPWGDPQNQSKFNST